MEHEEHVCTAWRDVLDKREIVVYTVVLTTPSYCLDIGSIALYCIFQVLERLSLWRLLSKTATYSRMDALPRGPLQEGPQEVI